MEKPEMKDNYLLVARIRQLLAVDRNAAVIYTELAKMAEDKTVIETLKQIAKDESHHVAVSLQLLKLLGES